MLEPDQITQAPNSRAGCLHFALFSLVRPLVVLLALQLSGVGHALADLRFFGDDASSEQHGDCSSEEPGRDCPPGCPTCHHANGGVGSLPLQAGFIVIPPVPEVANFAPSEADAPSSPELPSVFRPPKHA
jgi:hypothetical protein